ncbi:MULTISPECIES: iron ABC transporter permease [unclassified Paenibacillus]|uniref:ABC transporter permease n=1 Tax=unclassified Paenibacillus TaxID=185978 RepID=UPI001AE28998|nr:MULTISPECIES: iron ABC transporter permease [unclassified Paenibacillus]MBP1154915.1 iron(III) transport system permease protein [Paenibacillus sp. PvP091]MBP1169701.1 iron(III) transport system permease protein [Paenibacillus sp. PvR098]MBP2440729.1 iron(III) transport system permease protein [Paenibacillus sp. PvP052]
MSQLKRHENILITIFLVFLIFSVFFPIIILLLKSFQVDQSYSFEAWKRAWSEPGMATAIMNTLRVTFMVQLISVPLATIIAWLIARTNIVSGNSLEFLFWISFFLPTLGITSGWILVADPNYGLLNQLLMKLPFIDEPPFNIYSYWGIIFTHLTALGISVKVMLLVPAFRNMDASLEEAARTSGASTLGSLFKIVIPCIAPSLFVAFLMSLIRSFETFEIELVLGTPFHFSVFSTKIYSLVTANADYGGATALAMVIFVTMIPLVFLQYWISHRKDYTTLSGRFKSTKVDLGKWRWPITLLVYTIASLCTFVPVLFMLMGSLMNLFGYFNVEQIWSFRHWDTVLTGHKFTNSLKNMLILGFGSMFISVIVYGLMAYISVRTRYFARGAFDILTWIPFTIPGLVLGLGYFLMVLNTPVINQLYGTIFVIIFVQTLSAMTVSMQILKSNMLQLGFDLEEAGRALGGTWWYGFRRIITPLMIPAVVLVGVMAFGSAARNVSDIVLLTTSKTEPLGIVMLGYLMGEDKSAATVVGTIIVIIVGMIAFMARMFGFKIGKHNS